MHFATWMGEAAVGQIPHPPPRLLPQKTTKRKWSFASMCSGNYFFWFQKASWSHCHCCNWPLLLWMFPSFPFGWFLKVIFTKKKKRRKERPLPAWCICFLMLLDGITWLQKVKFGFFLLSLFSSPYPPTSFSSFLPSLFSLYFFLVHTFNLSVSSF